jgi:hypothetical protein
VLFIKDIKIIFAKDVAEAVSKQQIVTAFHRSGRFSNFKKTLLPEHGTVVTTAKTTVPCPPAPSSLPDDGMLFLSLKTF